MDCSVFRFASGSGLVYDGLQIGIRQGIDPLLPMIGSTQVRHRLSIGS